MIVAEGDLIGRTGNAGPCLAPHLHFEVQKQTSEAQRRVLGVETIPVDPYGWDGAETDCALRLGDPYPCITGGVKNVRLWAHRPIVNKIIPEMAGPGNVELRIAGEGFDSGVIEKIIRQSDWSEVPFGSVLSRTATEVVIQENLAAGMYFVHVENGDGRRSNWKGLVVE